MRTRTCGAALMLIFSAGLLVPQTTPDNPPPGGSAGAVKDIRADVNRLRVLLSQMQKNAAFVSQGDTPLKHEFELEIEMWQIVLNDMESKIDSAQSR